MMKVSELINQIVEVAENKFGVSSHNNDCISVEIFPSKFEWQVSICRPTQHNLDHGEIDTNLLDTVKLQENKLAFHSHADTLMKALYALLEKILDAEREDFQI